MTGAYNRTARQATRGRKQAMVAVTVALAVSVGGGVWAGRAAAPGDRAEPRSQRVVHAGPATLMVPREWRTAASGSDRATIVLEPSPGSPDRVIVTLAAADDRSLVPKALRGLVQDLGRGPRATRFAGHLAWRYTRPPARDGNSFDVTVLPTSAGVLAVACRSMAPTDCAPAIESMTVRVRGAEIYTPSPELALRLRLPGVLAALDAERIGTRSALRRAATHTRQAQLARRLERAHLEAADALRAAAGGAGASLPGELSDAASTYSALAAAAGAGSAARFNTAARSVRSAEARLKAATDRFLLTDAPVAALERSTETPSQGRARSGRAWTTIALLIAGLLAVGLATSLALGRGARSPERPVPPPAKAGADPPPPSALRRAQLPADSSARWDAPPPPRTSPGVSGPQPPRAPTWANSGDPRAPRVPPPPLGAPGPT